jgi:hypothetical protein
MMEEEIDLYTSLFTAILITLTIVYMLYKNYKDNKNNEKYINKKR